MEGIPEQDMIDHELRIQAGNQNGNKKAKSTGSGQYGELSLEQLQQQMAAHKAAISPTLPTGPVAVPAVAAAAVAYPPPPPPPPPQQPQAFYGYGQAATSNFGGYQAQGFNNQYYTSPPPLPPQQQTGYPTHNFGYNGRPPTG